MRTHLITAAIVILFSSCLKQSIPDAMLNAKNGPNITATLSYEVNGDPVNISVSDADHQDPTYYTLGCGKTFGSYNLEALDNVGELTFSFYTDSLAVGNYKYTSSYGPMYFLHHNGDNFVYIGYDSLSFNITSYKNGHISGNFSGLLTPQDATNNNYGPISSVIISNGVFKNVPVFY